MINRTKVSTTVVKQTLPIVFTAINFMKRNSCTEINSAQFYTLEKIERDLIIIYSRWTVRKKSTISIPIADFTMLKKLYDDNLKLLAKEMQGYQKSIFSMFYDPLAMQYEVISNLYKNDLQNKN